MKQSAIIVTLGCAKNLVDSETLAPQLIHTGYRLVENPAEASLIVINTCGFLQSAVEEAIQTILEMASFKACGACTELVVAGCMVQRYGRKLLNLLPEVDLFVGTSHYLELENILQARDRGNTRKLWIDTPRQFPTSETPRLRSTPQHFAYIKIAEGCSNRCSFCTIPHLRGRYRSRSAEDVLLEAKRLACEGVKEINLIAQDTTAFGLDRGDTEALSCLIESLEGISGIEWVRLLYTYPDRITQNLLQTIAQSKKTVEYLDLPIQHCVPRILQDMRRGKPSTNVRSVIDMIKETLPEISLRTSLMVGFPGETETDFSELLRFLEDVEFDHVGVFSFSPEDGTYAARLPLQVDQELKEERRHTLLEVQRDISRRRLRRFVGKTLPVMLEGLHPETDLLLTGRLATQAPEVDGSVIITRGSGRMGAIVPANITRVHDYDLEAELVSNDASELHRS